MENTYSPLKDYLSTTGKDFSFANLGTLAKEKGISGYTGTDEQNRQLSSYLKPNVSTTTVSNANKVGQVTGMMNTVDKMASGRGQTSGADGVTRYADGSIVPQTTEQTKTPTYSSLKTYTNSMGVESNPDGTPASVPQGATYSNGYYVDPSGKKYSAPANDTSVEDAKTQAILDQIKSSTDAQTAATIESIKQKFANYRSEQQQINQGQAAGVKNALLTGGVTGKGSSAQYAPISSEGIVASQLSYGAKKLQELDNQEQDLINQARAAGDSKNFQLLEKQLALVEQKRQEKIAAAKVLNDKIATQNAKAREQAIQATRDSALADVYSQGLTDPKEILKALNGNGGDFTLKEVTDGLKNLVPAGLDDLVKTLRNNGAPQDVIQKVLSSPDLSAAYKNAGNYAAGGTGIIGEYNFYRSQALSSGHNPVDFNTYQNMDANRKAKVASAGAGSGGIGTPGKAYANDLDAFVDNVINTIPTKFGQETFKNSISKARTDADKIRTSAAVVLKNSPAPIKEAFANQAVGMKEIDKAIQLLDEGTKTGAVQAGKQYTYNIVGKDFDPKLAAINAHIISAIQPYRNTVTGAAWGNQEDNEYQQLFGSTKYEPRELKERLLRVKDIMMEKSVQGLSSQVDPLGTGTNFFETSTTMGNNLIKSEDQAKSALKTYIQTNPGKATEIAGHIKVMEKQLGRPITTVEFYEAFPEYSK